MVDPIRRLNTYSSTDLETDSILDMTSYINATFVHNLDTYTMVGSESHRIFEFFCSVKTQELKLEIILYIKTVIQKKYLFLVMSARRNQSKFQIIAFLLVDT